MYGQLRPGNMAGVEGDLLMSGGAGHGIWLPRGADHQYVGGVSGGQPVYKTIPASDVTIGPTSAIDATDVQAAIEEVEAEKGPAPIVKADTGDPASGSEGQVCVNTFDKTIKIYGGGAWRTVATWT